MCDINNGFSDSELYKLYLLNILLTDFEDVLENKKLSFPEFIKYKYKDK